jgi:uncharacterized protein with beta-barrel porin domain
VPTDAALGAVYDAVSGEGVAGVEQTAFAADRMFVSAVNQEFDAWRRDAPASGGGLWMRAPGAGVATRTWSAAYGGFGSLNGNLTAMSGNLSYSGGGMAAGIERAWDSGILIGGAIGGDTSSFSVSSRDTSGNLDGLRAAAYGGVRSGPFYTLGVIAGAEYQMDEHRTFSVLGITEGVKGETFSHDLTARVESGFNLGRGPIGVTAFGAFQASNLYAGSFPETNTLGPSDFLLNFPSQTTYSRQSELGGQFDSTRFATSFGMLSASMRLSWVHEFATVRDITASFANFAGAPTFTVFGAAAAPDMARINLGIDLALRSNLSLFANFIGDYGGGASTSSANAGIRVNW